MKYGLIGCGRIAKNHIASAINNGLEIKALCDIKEEQAVNLLRKFNLNSKNINFYSSYLEMIANEDLDLVAIATESGSHAEIAKYCIKHKVNCIIEKPMAMNMNDARAICELAERYNVVVSANHQNRFNKSIQFIKKAIDQDNFGKLLHGTAHIRWCRDKNYYDQASWRGTWTNDGGCLMNQCIHNADLLRWLMGNEVEEVMAYTDNLKHDYIEAEDLGIAIFKFKNGAYGVFEGTVNTYPENLEETLYVFGEKGTAKAGGISTNLLEEWKFGGTEDAEKIKKDHSEIPTNVYGFGHTRLYADVIESIKSNRKPLVDAVAGMNALEMVLAIYESAAKGKPVKFPIGNVSSSDFKNRFGKEK